MLEVHDSLIAECARWGFRTPSNWESAAAAVRTALFPARTAELVGMLRNRGLFPKFDPPTFNVYGGWVTNQFQPELTSASGTIYYTLDESDPRLPGGGISPQARIWSPGAVELAVDTTQKARVRSANGQWSALAEPRYRVYEPLAVWGRVEAGSLQLTFAGIVGESYRVEIIDSLASPNWRLLQEIKPATETTIQVVDSGLDQNAARFYRVLWLPGIVN
jgi:hypothetical protein